MEFLALVAGLLVFFKICGVVGKRRLRRRIDATAQELELALRHFLAQPCSRCHEHEMTLLSVSPNARSIAYQCAHCQKNMHAAACSEDAFAALELHELLEELVATFNARHPGSPLEAEVGFDTPEAPLPFERMSREPIPEAVRAEVWRRDEGCCVACGANQNLEFDHLIPVSRGGATSARNLQLLCKPCNLRKGARI